MLFASLAAIALATGASAAPKCKNPVVKHEWRTLSNAHKAEYLNAVKCMTEIPSLGTIIPQHPTSVSTPAINPKASAYDDFVFIHADLNVYYRGTALIFPWHRWANDKFLKEMKSRCGYKGTLPYWDWTKDAADFENNDFFDDDPHHGVGGWGDPSNDNRITTGVWKDVVLNYPTPHGIRRNFTVLPWLHFPVSGEFPDPHRTSISTFASDKVDYVINCPDGDFECFASNGEGSTHIGGGFHTVNGGDMGGYCAASSNSTNCVYGAFYTPNDPTFWFHHSNLDRMWDTWQRKSPANKYAFSGGLTQNDSSILEFPVGQPPWASLDTVIPSGNLFGPKERTTVRDIMDTTGGFLCYVYAEKSGSAAVWNKTATISA